MATEIARIDVAPDSQPLFEAAARGALPLFREARGCHSMRLTRSHEHGQRYWLIVEWADVAAHQAFRETAAFAEWRSLVGPFLAAIPDVEHGLDTGIRF